MKRNTRFNSTFLLLSIGAYLMLSSCAKPVADFLITEEKIVAPAEIKFNNNSKKSTIYEWNFGDGNTSKLESPVHRYLHSGNYKVTLIAVNEKGKTSTKQTRIMVAPPKKCLVRLETKYGDMLIELYDDTPKHRDNFFKLAEEGFYDGLLFHRVIDGFMIQGGDPNSKNARPGQPLGTGGPGYQITAEFDHEHIHVKGALAAARQPDNVNPERKSSGSQFYIVHGMALQENDLITAERRLGISYTEHQKEQYLENGGYPFLDTQYTVFGRVVEGMDVIDTIAQVRRDGANRPLDDVVMKMEVIK